MLTIGRPLAASPAPSNDSSIVVENSQPAVPTPAAAAAGPTVTDSQEETLRRFFALPLDTVIEAGKRLGGSPSLKRLMDLGERARVRFSLSLLRSSTRLTSPVSLPLAGVFREGQQPVELAVEDSSIVQCCRLSITRPTVSDGRVASALPSRRPVISLTRRPFESTRA